MANSSTISASTSTPGDAFVQIAILYLEPTQKLAYIQFAVLTLFIWNFVTTLDVEVNHIWRRQRSVISVLFHIVRWFPLACTALSLWGSQSYNIKYWGKACEVWFWIESLGCVVVVQTLAESLMIMRIWALYQFSRRVLIALMVALSGHVAISIWAGVLPLSSLTRVPWPREALPIPGCLIIASPHIHVAQIACVYKMTSSLIIFLFLLNSCIARNPLENQFRGSWRDLFGVRTTQPIMHVLLRDGHAYFLIIVVAETILLISLSGKNPLLVLYVIPLIQAAYAIPATRLVLNLRDTSRDAAANNLQANEIVLTEYSRVKFASPPSNTLCSDITTRDMSPA